MRGAWTSDALGQPDGVAAAGRVLGNVRNATVFESRRRISKIGQPVEAVVAKGGSIATIS